MFSYQKYSFWHLKRLVLVVCRVWVYDVKPKVFILTYYFSRRMEISSYCNCILHCSAVVCKLNVRLCLWIQRLSRTVLKWEYQIVLLIINYCLLRTEPVCPVSTTLDEGRLYYPLTSFSYNDLQCAVSEKCEPDASSLKESKIKNEHNKGDQY